MCLDQLLQIDCHPASPAICWVGHMAAHINDLVQDCSKSSVIAVYSKNFHDSSGICPMGFILYILFKLWNLSSDSFTNNWYIDSTSDKMWYDIHYCCEFRRDTPCLALQLQHGIAYIAVVAKIVYRLISRTIRQYIRHLHVHAIRYLS